MARRRDKDAERSTAERRVRRLLERARAESRGAEPALADRYGELVRLVAEKYQLGLGLAAQEVCRGCSGFRVPGRNTRVRVRPGRVVTTCLRCGRIRRRPLEAKA